MHMFLYSFHRFIISIDRSDFGFFLDLPDLKLSALLAGIYFLFPSRNRSSVSFGTLYQTHSNISDTCCYVVYFARVA